MTSIHNAIDLYRGTYSDVPKDDNKAIDWIISRIKHNTPTSNKRKLTRSTLSENKGIRYEDTLDTYYVGLINDTLDEIRKGRSAYLFTFEQVQDVIKFEPTAQFTYINNDDYFEVKL
jgi:hypothetical protein